MFKLLVFLAVLAFALAAPKPAPQYITGLYGGYTGLGYGYGYASPLAYGAYGSYYL